MARPLPPGNLKAPAPIGRQPITETLLGAKVTAMPLPGDKSPLYLGHVTEIVTLGTRLLGHGFSALESGALDGGADMLSVKTILGILATVPPKEARELVELVLEIAPALVSSTTVILDGTKYELGNEDHRTALLDEHPDLYLPVAIFAGRVTYQRFFPATALKELATRARATSKTSSPST